MSSIEEEMRKKEIEWKKEMLYWKNRCIEVEERIDEVAVQVEKNEVKDPSEVKDHGIKEALASMKDDIIKANNGVQDMDRKWSSWFQTLSDKQEVADQHSRKNNALIHGFTNLPHLNGTAFIEFIANELNRLFPSLNGVIYPMHIDDAHPLKTKNSRSRVVIIRFVNRWLKNELINCQDDLYNTGLSITEHLTPHTIRLLKSTEKLIGTRNTHVFNTVVHAKFQNTNFVIKTENDLNKLKEAVNADATLTELTRHNNAAVNTTTTGTMNTFSRDNNSQHLPYWHNQVTTPPNHTPPFRRPIRGYPSRYGRGGGRVY